MDINIFERKLKLNYNSHQTIQTYINQIKPFILFCDGEITQENLDDYLLKRREEISTASYNLFLSAIKKYLEFVDLKLELPKQKNTKARKFPYITIKELENNIIKYTTLLFKNYEQIDVILYIMFWAGLRPKEIIQLEIKDIDFNKNLFIIKNGKGEKDRIIPFLNNKMVNKLKKFIGKKNGLLFDINKSKLTYIFKVITENCGFNYKLSPYTLRRSFAKHCIKIGMDISLVQIMMGHTDISMTLRYAQPDEKMLMEICEKIRIN